jgi:flavin reductase (DIM6/NTAB) family NADH-FMN oxidoreductase RutF
MRKNFGAKPILYPQPVFILAAYDENGIPNAMNAAWGGISEENEITLCIGQDHKTTANILSRKAFTVSMGTVDTVAACDYVGIASGLQTPDKLARCGWHTFPSDHVDAPLIDELPMAVECRLKSYDPQTCRMVGEVVNVCAEETVLTDGKIDPKKLRPIVFDGMNHTYLSLGEKVGDAFADGNTIG